ncbi:hypothetical protein BDV36DRAFT_81462 [Aspergillus pseudocaelatus]|uniref:Secreted protein n=1 Tax=Aspergillus pseudocaelatus TaxID=1825620 RepID=A0ABQ6W374_9EURO|nr:hypothetical protein BDV36DRAFT_81462 [Aspergillus pseudocaelatus]
MSTILLVIYYLYTIISLLHSGWAQPNQYSYSLLHSTPKNLCSIPGTHYCTHGSLHSPEILFCVSHTRAELRSCNIELARIIPKGYEGWALCTVPLFISFTSFASAPKQGRRYNSNLGNRL